MALERLRQEDSEFKRNPRGDKLVKMLANLKIDCETAVCLICDCLLVWF